MRVRPCHGLGEIIAQAAMSCKEQISNDIGIDVPNVKNLFSICERQACISKELLSKYTLNMHLIDVPKIVLAEKDASSYREEVVSFFSKRQNESNYVCSIVLQKPDNEIYSVSAYLMETYLGRFVFRANWYFRKSNKQKALDCYREVVKNVTELKKDFIQSATLQSLLPSEIKEKLKQVEGEIQPRTNEVATFLNPKNVSNGAPSIITIPQKRNITDDLIME